MYNLKDVILDRISTFVFAADGRGDVDISGYTELIYILDKYKLITKVESDMLMSLYTEVLAGKKRYYVDIVRDIVPYNDPEI